MTDYNMRCLRRQAAESRILHANSSPALEEGVFLAIMIKQICQATDFAYLLGHGERIISFWCSYKCEVAIEDSVAAEGNVKK